LIWSTINKPDWWFEKMSTNLSVMKKIKKLVEIPDQEIKDGEEIYHLGASMADADPFVYGRLLKAGKHEEAEKMLNEKGYWVLLEDGTYM